MGSEQFRIKGVFDESGIRSGAKGAETAVKGIGGAVDQQSRKLNKYGERLGKTFGKNQGLHGRLDSLEMPLRDAEGSIDRVQFAVREFGNAGATATDKISAGFLLAGDSIATLVSGGYITRAIAGVVALGAAIAQSFTAAEREAEEAKKSFQELAAEAVRSSVTIRAVQVSKDLDAKKAKARAIEETIKADEGRLRTQLRMLDEAQVELVRREKVWRDHRWGKEGQEFQNKNVRDRKSEVATARRVLKQNKDLQKRVLQSVGNLAASVAKSAASDVESITGQALAAADKLIKGVEAQRDKAEGTTPGSRRSGGGRAAAKAAEGEAFAIQAEATLARVAADRAFERQVEIENRAFDRDDKAETLRIDLAMEDERRAAAKRTGELKAQIYQEQIDAFKKAHEVEIMLLGLTTNALFDMAKAGEFSGKALLASVLEAVGQEAMAKGTLHLLEGLATGNPAKMAAGSGLIGLGVALGGAAGVVERSGAEQAAAASGSATPSPSDTRSSRAASSGSGGGDGGQVVINFNGDVYDRRGVASVLSSGNRMAKHRRMAG